MMTRTSDARRLTLLLAIATAGAVAVGCAESQGIRPGDMSAAQHRAAARGEEREATKSDPCMPGAQGPSGGPCWTSRMYPSEEAQRDAEMHRSLAAEHRKAASLRKAADEICAGVSEVDRMQNPFSHQEDIVSVQPLVRYRAEGGTGDAGAIVMFREVPGLSVEGFQKIIDCHLARNESLGVSARELDFCPLSVNPLVLKEIKATVVQRVDGLAVKLRSNDESVGREILQRAQGLVGVPRCLRTPPSETDEARND